MFFWFTEVRKSEFIFKFSSGSKSNKDMKRNESSTFKIFENHLSKNPLKKAFLVNVLFD